MLCVGGSHGVNYHDWGKQVFSVPYLSQDQYDVLHICENFVPLRCTLQNDSNKNTPRLSSHQCFVLQAQQSFGRT